MKGVEVMRIQADEKMKSTEQMIFENRMDTARKIHAGSSFSKAPNDKLKNRATTALSRESSGNHARNIRKDLTIANLKGSHATTHGVKMDSNCQDVKRKSVEELRDLKKSYDR